MGLINIINIGNFNLAENFDAIILKISDDLPLSLKTIMDSHIILYIRDWDQVFPHKVS